MVKEKTRVGMSITMPKHLLKDVDKQAIEERRTRSQMIAVLVERGLQKTKEEQIYNPKNK